MKRENAIKIVAENLLLKLSKDERINYLDDWWVLEEEDIDLQKIPLLLKNGINENLKNEIRNNTKYGNPENEKYNPLIVIAIFYEFRGVKNQYLESEINRIIGKEIEISGRAEILEKCPCCGYKTLDSKCEWDICKVCFWEDDCTTDLDKYSGPNHITLRKGKDNFIKYGACDEKSINHVDKDGKLKYER